MSGAAPGVAQTQIRRHRGTMRWLALALIVAVVLAAFILPLININRYHRTISESLARSIGHPVFLGSVKLQLLPRPGLAITDFVVEENPGFGAEPLLRSASVVVSLRIASLWRGRLEVSRIDLEDASLNLVHGANGQWNFASLLEQASRIPNAPTAQRHASSTPRFPYIQFKSARINFKSGNEKKGFAFLNSELSIWLDNPQQWRLRFEAQPVRTDLALQLEDTGLMRLEGSLDRASALSQMPVKLHAEWNRAELGQASRMIFANDSGWRGDLRAEADLVGNLDDLNVATRVRIADAHREEFSPLTQLNIDARCRADYLHASQTFNNLTCLWPVGDGHLLLTGDVQRFSSQQAHLKLEINQTPASFAVNLLGLVRASLPASVSADGLINGSFAYAGDTPSKLSGQATITPLTLKLSDDGSPFTLPMAHFSTHDAVAAPTSARNKKAHVSSAAAPAAGTIFLDTASVNMGAPNPFQVSGEFTSAGFNVRFSGQSGVGRFKSFSPAFNALRASATHLAAQGIADVDLTFSGPWLAEPSPSADPQSGSASRVQGWLRLQNAQAALDWLPEPVQIAAATLNFGDGRVRWTNANASINGVILRGSADMALHCEGGMACPAHFNLDVPQLDAAALQSSLLGAGRHGELLNAILAEVGRKTAPWPEIDGQAHVGVFTLGKLALTDVRSSISVKDHRLQITSLDASVLGGSMHANATVEASGSKPQYSIETNWSGIHVADIAPLFDEDWPATGMMDGGVHLVLQGYSLSDLAGGAQGTFHWLWHAGSLLPPSDPPVGGAATLAHFNEWSANGSVANRTLTLNKAGAANPVTGTISFDRRLDLLWPDAASGTPAHIGGTMTNPAVVNSETAAK
jgi:AsmA family